MPVVAFPCRPPGIPPDTSQRCSASAQIIPFPRQSPDSLTNPDLHVLWGLMSHLGDRWVCETHRDSNGDLCALIAPRNPPPDAYTAYLVRRSSWRLVLSDARLSARWGTLGVFEQASEVVAALGRRIGLRPWRRQGQGPGFRSVTSGRAAEPFAGTPSHHDASEIPPA